MAMLVFLLLLSAAMVGFCHLLPRHLLRGQRPHHPFRAVLLACGGFVLAQAVVSAAIAGLGLSPKGPFHDLMRQLTGYQGEQPVVLVVGSSFTKAGIDAGALAEMLGSSGHPAVVQRLAVDGAPHLERLHYLKEYLARAKRAPQLVLFEIAGGYDSGPLYQVHQMRFSDRMVAMMDGSNAWWALRWLAGTDRLSVPQRLALASEILSQWALHVSHIGTFWNSAPVREDTAYADGMTPARFSDTDAAGMIERAAATHDLRPEWSPDVPTPWMSAFLTEEMAILQRRAATRVAFYSVPSMQGADVAYAHRFCAALGGRFGCFVGEDPGLLAELEHGADWYNFDHLQGAGSEAFTRWLGDRLVERGVWP